MTAARPLPDVAESRALDIGSAWRVEVLRPSRQIRVRTLPARGRATRTRAAAAPSGFDYRARALALWPRLDAEKLRRTRGDVLRIARLVERRTACSFEMIVGMLTRGIAE